MKRSTFIILALTVFLLSTQISIYSYTVAQSAKNQAAGAEASANAVMEQSYAAEQGHPMYVGKAETDRGSDISLVLTHLEYNTLRPGDYVYVNPGTNEIDYLSKNTIRVKVISLREILCDCDH